MQSAWRCLLLIGLAALGTCAVGGLEADWASLQPFYQQGITAAFPSVSPAPSATVRTIDPWDYGNLCALLDIISSDKELSSDV